ncbi:MAG TPA: methyltransferase [Candidatus Deferrimicrobium sp.]|nr:methyltransferase [Candidatus Deferrimicrobium sp.]
MNRGTSPGGLFLRQPDRGYRFSIDSVILAGFAAPFCRGAVLDLGTGCGILLLLLNRLAPGIVSGTGVDLQEDLLDFARGNFHDNCPDGRLSARHGDFRGDIPGVEPGSFDLVVSNPPYGRAGHGRRNPDPGKEAARHEVTCTLPELFASASRFLSANGRFAFILPYPRISEIEPCAAKEGMRVELLRAVHPRDDAPPSRLLCCTVRGGRGTPRLLRPLFLHGGMEGYCPEVERICRLLRAG